MQRGLCDIGYFSEAHDIKGRSEKINSLVYSLGNAHTTAIFQSKHCNIADHLAEALTESGEDVAVISLVQSNKEGMKREYPCHQFSESVLAFFSEKNLHGIRKKYASYDRCLIVFELSAASPEAKLALSKFDHCVFCLKEESFETIDQLVGKERATFIHA